MTNSRSAYLLERLSAATANVTTPEDHWNDEDIEDASLEAIRYLRDALDVPAFERELLARSRVDSATLKEFADAFAAVELEKPPPFGMTFPDGTSFDWGGRIERLQAMVSGLEHPEGLEELEVALRINLVGDAAFASMLMALAPDHPLRGRLQEKLLSKLALLSDDQALAYWASLRSEVDPSRETHIAVDTSVAPNEFFDLGEAAAARARIAEYLARVRPLLVRRTFEAGTTHIPAGRAGIASILSWTEHPSTRTWSPEDRAVIRALGRVAFCWRWSKADLADALGVQVGGYFVGGRAEQEAKRSLSLQGNKAPTPTRITTELSKLILMSEQRGVARQAPVERALRSYKLGLEVMAQDLREEFKGKGELRLQREMCRFLVERDIRAYGTKFGWSEVDLRADDDLGAVVVEVKLVKKTPSERDINRWLTQLGSYMDQEHLALRGVLVLYNFSATPILCPIDTIRMRYLVLAINLCEGSPSKRNASIEIEAAREGAHVINVLKLGESDAKKRKRRSKATARDRSPRAGRTR